MTTRAQLIELAFSLELDDYARDLHDRPFMTMSEKRVRLEGLKQYRAEEDQAKEIDQ